MPDTTYNAQNTPPRREQYRSTTRAQKVFRALGLSLIYNVWIDIRYKGKSVPEPTKTAIYKDARTAFLAGLIHLIPISASLVLVVLNWRGYYIGGELAGATGQDDAKFLALQFAAKLHELAIVASLAAVIFSYIRHELVKNNGMPFGAIAAGLSFKDVSFLWSVEFWGIVRSHWKRTLNKIVMILLIVICGALAVSAGPSSATLMKPRLDDWPGGGTDFWISMPPGSLSANNVSSNQVTASCSVDTGDLSCPSTDWQTIAQSYMSHFASIQPFGYLPDTLELSGYKATREVRAYQRSVLFQFSATFTVASVSFCSVADAIVDTGRLWAYAVFNWRYKFHERLWSRIDATYHVGAPMPVVHTRCVGLSNSTGDPYFSAFLSGQFTFYDLWDLDFFQANGDFAGISFNYTDSDQPRSLLQNINSTTVPEIAWLTIPQSNGTSLGALLLIPQPRNETSILACTLDPRLQPATITSTRDRPAIVTSDWIGSTYGDGNSLTRIQIDPGWAAYLTPTVPSTNSTVFQETMRIAGVWGSNYTVQPYDAVYVAETYLALSVVNGLSRRDFGTGFSGTLVGKHTDGMELVNIPYAENNRSGLLQCDEWCRHFLPKTGYAMGHGGNAFNVSSSEKASSTQLTMSVVARGWAYSARGDAAKFSIFALLLYVFIALIHWVCTSLYRESSNSWDSVSELVALAMNSDRSAKFRNTGAGINSLTLFKRPVQIVERDGALQLAIDNPVGPYRAVEYNELYG